MPYGGPLKLRLLFILHCAQYGKNVQSTRRRYTPGTRQELESDDSAFPSKPLHPARWLVGAAAGLVLSSGPSATTFWYWP